MTAPAMTLVGHCPDCGKPLRVRSNRQDGSAFVGCSSWPDCRFAAPVLEALAEPLAELERAAKGANAEPREAEPSGANLSARILELVSDWHPDRHPEPIPSERVCAELNRLRSEVSQ